jgi:hypothetical protein
VIKEISKRRGAIPVKRFKNSFIFIILAVLFISGWLKLHQTSLNNEYLKAHNADLQLMLLRTEELCMQRQQTLIYILSGRGATMPVLTPSGFTEELYEQAWLNLGASGLEGTGEAIAAAEQETGVNGLVLAAIAYLESGGGSSQIAEKKNNLFGLGAADANPYAHALAFDHKKESVYFAAELLSRNYLSREGRYYHGDDLYAVGRYYASDPRWADKVNRAMAIIAAALLDSEL